MEKIKIIDTLESVKATAPYGVGSAVVKMFGNTYNDNDFEVKEDFYVIKGWRFAKESCEIIEDDDRPILEGEPPELAYYELSDDKEEWTPPCLIICYDKDAAYPYRNLYDIYKYARKVEL
jgi:hypothetical protein